MATNLPEYTDLKRTRIAEPRHGEHSRTRLDEQMGNTQPINMKEGLLDGLSIPQIVAGAAAAATSMLLASKIGFAGSVIGAAVSSVVTVVATQLYRRALTVGVRKIKTLDPGRTTLVTPTDTNPYGRANRTTSTRIAPEGYRMSAGVPGARVAPNILQARAAEQRSAVQRKVIFASVGVAMLAVALCAGAVLLVTAGEGLGDRPASVVEMLGTGVGGQADEDAGTAKPAAAPSASETASTTTAGSKNDASSSDGTANSSASSSTGANQGASNSSTSASDSQSAGTDGDSSANNGASTDSPSKSDGTSGGSSQDSAASADSSSSNATSADDAASTN